MEKTDPDTDVACERRVWLPDSSMAFLASASVNAWKLQKANGRCHRFVETAPASASGVCATGRALHSALRPREHTAVS